MKTDINILGIETSCDETAAAVVRKFVGKNGCEFVIRELPDRRFGKHDCRTKYSERNRGNVAFGDKKSCDTFHFHPLARISKNLEDVPTYDLSGTTLNHV